MNTIKIKSNRLGEDFEVEVYQKDEVLIIRHTSLENIFWGMPDEQRPEMTVDTVDLGRMPGIPPMFAVRCVLKDPVSGCSFEQFGEMLCSNWQVASKITRDFPLTMCKNQAFDRAFVRFLQFDISGKAIALYSDSEIEIPNGLLPYAEADGQGAVAVPEQDETTEQVPATTGSAPAVQETQPGPSPIPDTMEMFFGQGEPPADPAGETPAAGNAGNNTPADIWSGMGADDTLAAYGYEPQETPPDFTDIQDGFGTGAPSPFPWSQNGQAKPAEVPAKAQMPDYGIPAAPAAGAKAGCTLTVYEVSFDLSIGKTLVKTNAGTVMFDPFSMIWETQEFDLSTVNLDDLYQQASSFIGYDLKEYNGMTLP